MLTIQSVSTGVITTETSQEQDSTTVGIFTVQSVSTGIVTMETTQEQAEILIEASTIYVSGASAETATVYMA